MLLSVPRTRSVLAEPKGTSSVETPLLCWREFGPRVGSLPQRSCCVSRVTGKPCWLWALWDIHLPLGEQLERVFLFQVVVKVTLLENGLILFFVFLLV